MKKLTIGILIVYLTISNLFATEIEMNTRVESVTIYHSGALVTRIGTTELKSGINELLFKNVSSKIILNSLKVSNKEVTVLNKSIIRKLTKEEFNQLLDKIDALNKQMTLIETKYKEVGFVSKVDELEKMTAFYSNKILQIKKEIREIEKNIEEAKKLENIELENENAGILKLIVSIDGNIKEPFKIQYVCGGIGWTSAYEINVESSAKKEIEIKYLAKTMSQTGENWDNIVINLSSSFPLESPTELPKQKTPWVLEGGNYNNNRQSINELNQQNVEQQQISKLEGVEYQEINISSFLKLRTLKEKYSIKSNSTVFTFPIQTVILPANFYYYSFPSIEPEVYLVAQVTAWDTLGFVDGIANIMFSGNNLGKSVIKFSETKDTLLLPIGKDNNVFLKRSEIADQKYFRITSIGKKRKTTFAYKFELKNNNPFPIQIELIDQIPISQTKLAEVEVEKNSNGNLNMETGEITWLVELKPGQSTDKELIFTIEMDANYKYFSGNAKRKFKTINAPSF